MARKLLAALAVVLFAATSAFGQERGIGAGRVEIGAFPGGGMFFTKTSNGNEPGFGPRSIATGLAFGTRASVPTRSGEEVR